MRQTGFRFPCKICGADRTGQPINSVRVAVCKDCLPAYKRKHNNRHFISVYLPGDLKAKLDATAEAQATTSGLYIRALIRSALSGD